MPVDRGYGEACRIAARHRASSSSYLAYAAKAPRQKWRRLIAGSAASRHIGAMPPLKADGAARAIAAWRHERNEARAAGGGVVAPKLSAYS